MKKSNLKSLELNKKSISNLNDNSSRSIKGGSAYTIVDDNCVVSFGPIRCGATSAGFVCAAACAPDDK